MREMQPRPTKKRAKPTRSSSGSIALAALAALGLAQGLAAQSTETAAADAGASAPEAPSGALAKLPAARRFRDAMIDSRDFSAALKPATEAVAMQSKTRDPDYPTDLTTLARVQAELGQLDKAEMNY